MEYTYHITYFPSKNTRHLYGYNVNATNVESAIQKFKEYMNDNENEIVILYVMNMALYNEYNCIAS